MPWLYDSTTATWLSYDDPQSVAAKASYVREHHVSGVVIWEPGGDDGALMRNCWTLTVNAPHLAWVR